MFLLEKCFIALQRDGEVNIALICLMLVCRTRILEWGTRKGLYLGMRKYSASWSLYLVYFRCAARNLHIEVNVLMFLFDNHRRVFYRAAARPTPDASNVMSCAASRI